MKKYYVYIVKCHDSSYYIGVTNDVERRMDEHNAGKIKTAYTYFRRPVVLVFVQEFADITQAIVFEKQLKGWSRKKKEAIISDQWHLLPALSKNRNK
ncbi:putative endonuclease [Dyadobacter jejuensis]|uniref:Putative endonuclease n=1 Tax=Dyadobacter jejuensis TaxID=1082580 RepID=A0A316ASN8_9BACT|nr:GIY-YIG nuclease family protein [Dyadobacter jejuensis]PWJ60471.1 putative endonuclease [Dyadobacter jejuensis]